MARPQPRSSLPLGYKSSGAGSTGAVGETKRERKELGSLTIVSIKTNVNVNIFVVVVNAFVLTVETVQFS